jgi:hypothetical protein
VCSSHVSKLHEPPMQFSGCEKYEREREGIGVVSRETVRPKFTTEIAQQIVRLWKPDVTGSYSCHPLVKLTGKMLSPSYSVLDKRGLKDGGIVCFGSRQEDFWKGLTLHSGKRCPKSLAGAIWSQIRTSP